MDNKKPPTEQNRKMLALLICLFLALFYKQAVWDRYTAQQEDNLAEQQGPEQSAAPVATVASPRVQQTATTGQAQPASAAEPQAAEAAADVPAVGAYPSDSRLEEAGFIQIETKALDVSISLLGGRVGKLLLKEHTEENTLESPPLNLVEHVDQTPYPAGVYSGGLDDLWVKYEFAGNADSLGKRFVNEASGSSDFILRGVLSDGRTIVKTYTFYPSGYFIDLDVTIDAPPADDSSLELEWLKLAAEDESSMFNRANVEEFAWFDGQKASHEVLTDYDAPDTTKPLPSGVIPDSVNWISLQNAYFTKTLIALEGAKRGRVLFDGEFYRVLLSGSSTKGSYRLFLGPKSYRMLRELGYELQRTVDFGWAGFVSEPLMRLLHIFYGFFGNYGLAIVLLTIVVKLAIYPLTSTSFKSMKAMQEIQPDVKRLRETVKDKQQQQQQLMKLYKEKGVNPLGGCLPIILQMPIFIGLYYGLMVSVELRHANFIFWITDLSAPEKCIIAGAGIPVMVILFVISMMVQQFTTPSTMDPVQKKMMLVMPIVFGFMFMNFAAGLTLYWLTSNLMTIAQYKGLRSERGGMAQVKITGLASVGVFALAYLLVMLDKAF